MRNSLSYEVSTRRGQGQLDMGNVMDDAVRQRIRPQSADDRLTLVTATHLDAKDQVEQPDTGSRTTNHADTHFYAAKGKSPKQPQQIGASRLSTAVDAATDEVARNNPLISRKKAVHSTSRI